MTRVRKSASYPPGERPETRGRKPIPIPQEQIDRACELLASGKIPGKMLWRITGFPGETTCRRTLSEHLLGRQDGTWVQMYTFCAVKRMQESPDYAKSIPTILCGDCPFFQADEYLTRINNAYIRFGTCAESGSRTERCSYCIYGIYEDSCYPDHEYIVHEGRHIKQHVKRKS